MFSFKKFLDESGPITAGNVHQLAGPELKNLTDREEYQKIKQADSTLAKKMELAWEGDAHDFKRNPDKFDPLFKKLVDVKTVARLAPSLKITNETEKDLKNLAILHDYSFRVKKPVNAPNDIWSHGGELKLQKESFERQAEYEELMETIQNL